MILNVTPSPAGPVVVILSVADIFNILPMLPTTSMNLEVGSAVFVDLSTALTVIMY